MHRADEGIRNGRGVQNEGLHHHHYTKKLSFARHGDYIDLKAYVEKDTPAVTQVQFIYYLRLWGALQTPLFHSFGTGGEHLKHHLIVKVDYGIDYERAVSTLKSKEKAGERFAR